jgi:hypothetical protein
VLKKLPGVLCPHWTPGIGCAVYETRSAPCRGHYCGWRLRAELEDCWRPDISNVYVRWITGPVRDFREQLPDAQSYFVMAIEGDIDGRQAERMSAFSARLIRQEFPVFLEAPAPSEWVRRRLPLNQLLKPFLGADSREFLEAFKLALEASGSMPLAKAYFDETGKLCQGQTITPAPQEDSIAAL